jgi:hypothetical protein
MRTNSTLHGYQLQASRDKLVIATSNVRLAGEVKTRMEVHVRKEAEV